VINRIRDGRSRAGDADLAHASRAHRIEGIIRFTNEIGFDRMNVSVHRHVVIGKIARGWQSGDRIVNSFFLECHPYAHDNPAENLAAACLQINHAPAIHHADPPCNSHERQLRINLHFAKLRAETLESELVAFLKIEFPIRLERVHSFALQRFGERLRFIQVRAEIGKFLFQIGRGIGNGGTDGCSSVRSARDWTKGQSRIAELKLYFLDWNTDGISADLRERRPLIVLCPDHAQRILQWRWHPH